MVLKSGTIDSTEDTKSEHFENILENKGLFEIGAVPKWLRERSAKPLFDGSNPSRASKNFWSPCEWCRGNLHGRPNRLLTGFQNRNKVACPLFMGG